MQTASCRPLGMWMHKHGCRACDRHDLPCHHRVCTVHDWMGYCDHHADHLSYLYKVFVKEEMIILVGFR